jgi:hypothetical protein
MATRLLFPAPALPHSPMIFITELYSFEIELSSNFWQMHEGNIDNE